jgi:hypothetical protein
MNCFQNALFKYFSRDTQWVPTRYLMVSWDFLIKNQNHQFLCCVMSLVVGITGIGPALSLYSSNAHCISRYITHIISRLVGTPDLRTLWHMTSLSPLLTILRTLYITKQHNSKCLFLKKGVICKSKFKYFSENFNKHCHTCNIKKLKNKLMNMCEN